MKYWFVIAVALLLLTGCSRGPLLSDVRVADPEINAQTGPRVTTISYRIGAPATVSVWLHASDGSTYILRDEAPREASSDPYTLQFNGSAPIDPHTERVLADGTYSVVVRATPLDGGPSVEQQAAIQITAAPTDPFDVYDVRVTPNPFTPNDDAQDDVTNITYRLPVTATVSIEFIDPSGQQRYPFVTREQQAPGEQRQTWSGRPVIGGVLPGGEYTYELTAEDGRGNRVTKTGPVIIENPGVGEMQLLSATIAPEQITLGEIITVTYRVKNVGSVPIRTHGPPSGYLYESTNQTYGNIDGEKWASKGGGLWRVGLDWEGNAGSALRYPFRWSVSPRPPDQWADPNNFDYLQPGEEAAIIGRVRVTQPENRMTFFVGLAHEGVDYPYDRYKQTLIKVDF